MKREAVPDYGATEDECRDYFSACAALRENRGHVDLLRGQHYRKRAQFFALYDDVRALPPNTAWTKLREMHDWFLSQIQENSDLVSRCKTGAEVDAAAAQHRTAALLSVEGADLLYHETTYAHAEHKIARERGHSTTVEAARLALKAGAGRLVIGHYSSRYKEESVLVEEARTVFPDTHPATEGTTFTIEKRQQP